MSKHFSMGRRVGLVDKALGKNRGQLDVSRVRFPVWATLKQKSLSSPTGQILCKTGPVYKCRVGEMVDLLVARLTGWRACTCGRPTPPTDQEKGKGLKGRHQKIERKTHLNIYSTVTG